ncbi:MAG TPA: PH domain-containing protein [Planctomycetes bacterium]|nr:PH domain-containing protein [Planctomycetota bacterium]
MVPEGDHPLLVGGGGIMVVNHYRRSFTYYLTDIRIAMHQDFLGLSKHERQVRYNHIEDIKLMQSLFGRIFGFGTVVPVTGSGLGTGTDEALMIAAIGGEAIFSQDWFSQVPFYDFLIGISVINEVVAASIIWSLALLAIGFAARYLFLENGGRDIFRLYGGLALFGIGVMVLHFWKIGEAEGDTVGDAV